MKTLSLLSDSDLISSFRDVLLDEREVLVRELEHLIELDRRRLTFQYSSLWDYLVHELGIPEWAAEQKLRAARLLRRFPELKEKLESGKLNLSLLEMAIRVATREKLEDSEFREVLGAISGLRCKAARREIARRFPSSKEDYPDRVTPISAELSEVRFVAPIELLEKLDEIKGVLAHSHPGIKLAELIDVIATDYRKHWHPEERARRTQQVAKPKAEPQRQQKDEKPQAGTDERNRKQNEVVRSPVTNRRVEKRIPGRKLVRELIQRDGYVCSFIDPVSGKKCSSTHALEVDHITPWSAGGATELKNLRFLCRGHHSRVSFVSFGDLSKFSEKEPRSSSP